MPVRFEDMTRDQRVKLLMTDLDAYLAVAGQEQLLQILDGVARTKKNQKKKSTKATKRAPA